MHADGEIWSQTLWDLRDALGSNTVEGIVTRAMELAPSNPSFLDMRNSILQADLVANGGANHDTIWSTFAHRGMGYFAGAVDGDDAFPVENFALPPTDVKFGKLLGKVVDADTNLPIVGAAVLFGGHASGFPDDIAGLTNEDGVYDIKKIPVGTYPKVWATAPGYDRQVLPTVTDHAERDQDRLEAQAQLGVPRRRRLDRLVHRPELRAAVPARGRDRRLGGRRLGQRHGRERDLDRAT